MAKHVLEELRKNEYNMTHRKNTKKHEEFEQKIESDEENDLEDDNDIEKFIILKFIATTEYFRLENQSISYEYEIKVSNTENEINVDNEKDLKLINYMSKLGK